jgi:hypothetical protein
MYCIDCGVQLPEGARFCPSCGNPQQLSEQRAAAPHSPPPASRSAETEERWDYCEIRYSEGLLHKNFEAVALGAKGSKTAGKVLARKSDDAGNVNRANVSRLVNALIAAGWEPQPKGSEWYAYRFRRRSTPA